jgi:hypothetical protein
MDGAVEMTASRVLAARGQVQMEAGTEEDARKKRRKRSGASTFPSDLLPLRVSIVAAFQLWPCLTVVPITRNIQLCRRE